MKKTNFLINDFDNKVIDWFNYDCGDIVEKFIDVYTLGVKRGLKLQEDDYIIKGEIKTNVIKEDDYFSTTNFINKKRIDI